jgi:TetR/AcrR family transcriptional regulator
MSTTDRKEREKALRYEAIVNTAEQLFFSRGFENVTMEDIAKELELAKGTLYLYFKNKDELYFAIVLRGLGIMNRMFRESVGGKKSGLDNAYAIGLAFYDFHKRHPEYSKAFGCTTSERLENLGAETAAEIDRLNEENLRMLIEALAAGVKDGSIRGEVDPTQTAIFLIESTQAMIQLPLGMDKVADSLGIDRDELFSGSLDMLKRAIRS